MPKTLSLIKTLAACGLAVGVAGCSTDIALFRADSSWWSSSGKSAADQPLSPPVVAADALLGPQGACPPAAAAAAASGHAVGIGMTECEVVNALGPTGLVDIGTDERGGRAVVLTYPEGARAGVYRFASGRLVSIEQLPQQPKPQRGRGRHRG